MQIKYYINYKYYYNLEEKKRCMVPNTITRTAIGLFSIFEKFTPVARRWLDQRRPRRGADTRYSRASKLGNIGYPREFCSSLISSFFFSPLFFFGFVDPRIREYLPAYLPVCLRPKVLRAKRAFRHPIDVARYESFLQ